MSMYRIRQFYLGITSKITLEDMEFIKKYLNKDEVDLFNKLLINEQSHSVRVAREVEKIIEKDKVYNRYLVKVALLHDIGKIKGSLNIIDKSILVLLNKFTKGKLRKLKNIKKINIYYNHGKIGSDILKSLGYNERFLYLVKNHHNNDIIGDMELDILKKCDDIN